MRKIDDGEKERKKEKKITAEIVANNVVASRLPNGDRLQWRPLMPIFDYWMLRSRLIETGKFPGYPD